MKLLETLVRDENSCNKKLYSSGIYWNYKNKVSLNEIKKKGLKDFRGASAGIGTSFTDNLVLDIKRQANFEFSILAFNKQNIQFTNIFD